MKKVLAALSVAGLLLAGGCASLPVGFTEVREIKAAPASFDGKEVKLKGRLKVLAKVPLMEVALYSLDDGTGEIVVIPAEKTMPIDQGTVVISGVVDSMAIMGGSALGLHIRDARKLSILGN
jgi:hypothetical protein